MSSPFLYGSPVPRPLLVGRERELRHVVNRLLNVGQSTVIIGEPKTGKTSLLHYLLARETRDELSARGGIHLLCSFIDAQGLSGQVDQHRFWHHALRPVRDELAREGAPPDVVHAWQQCDAHGFDALEIASLLETMAAARWRLTLLIDEVSELIRHPMLGNGEFFGSLRSLVSRAGGALALVAASRYDVSLLDDATASFSAGSPYFNFLSGIRLGPLSPSGVERLLQSAKHVLTESDLASIRELTGGHPYLLQVLGAALWDSVEDGIKEPESRRQQGLRRLYQEAARVFDDMWRFWSQPMRQTFATVALSQLETTNRTEILPAGNIDVELLVAQLRNFRPEVDALEERGLIEREPLVPGGHRIRPEIALVWFTDRLGRVLRRGQPLSAFLSQNWTPGTHRSLITQEEDGPPDGSAGFRQVPHQGTLRLLYAYAEPDEPLCKRLDAHLGLLQRSGWIRTWSHCMLLAGDNVESQVEHKFQAADLIVLLISVDYLSSRAWDLMMNRISQRRGLSSPPRLIPVLLRPVDYVGAQFEGHQILPRNGKPISLWGEPDEAWAEVTKDIRGLVKELRDGKA